MILGALLLTAALAAVPQHEQASPAAAEAPRAQAAPAEGAEAAEGHGGSGEKEGHGPSQILMHHVTDEAGYRPFGLPFPVPTKHMFFLLLVMALVIVVARLAIGSYKDGAPRGIGSAVEALVVYVRDEMAEKSIGHGEGEKYTPLLLSFFFFILFAALFGLLPFSATSTGNISVTFALALISFVAQQYAGMSKYGVVGHFKNLVPHGLPWPLLIVMIPIEVLGMFTKPFALMIRLFANMLAGHMMITALLMLVALCYPVSVYLGMAMIPISLGMTLFIMCLEILVAFIQAYVFTLFSAIFIGMYAHPSH
jgi:F-type H+-transporting ATPase subunit a